MAKEREGDVERLRVMVVDGHALFRRGLEMVLGGEPDLDLVGEASDGPGAIEKATELMSDVVLMDVRMPRRSGVEATAQTRDLLPHVKDPHAHDQRRGERSLRRDQGRRLGGIC